MGLMSIIAENGLITAGVTIIGSAITYFVTKSNNNKDMTINDRVQLSQDQYRLIAELREIMMGQKEQIEGLRVEIRELYAVNLNLTVQNEQFQAKVNMLSDRINFRFSDTNVERQVE